MIMSKKVGQYIINHPARCFISFWIFLFLCGVVSLLLPQIVAEIIAFCLLVCMIVLLITSLQKEKKEKQKLQTMGKEDYKKKWELYLNLVNEVIDEKDYARNKLNEDWIQTFNQVINAIATNQYLLRRKFNDFDIAACLVYSLTLDNDTDENILLAFDCAKRLINEPKEYIRDLGYGYKLELEVEKTFSKVNITIPDDVISPEALTSIIRAYLIQKTDSGILQLSDFLHILYLKCSNT